MAKCLTKSGTIFGQKIAQPKLSLTSNGKTSIIIIILLQSFCSMPYLYGTIVPSNQGTLVFQTRLPTDGVSIESVIMNLAENRIKLK